MFNTPTLKHAAYDAAHTLLLPVLKKVGALLAICLPLFAFPKTGFAQTDCAVQTEIPQLECEALVALYTSTNGAGWSANTGWNQDNAPCAWYGVTCGGGSVTHLRLDSNQLSGGIPVELGNLTGLTFLDLGFNQLSGGIPVELGNLTNLAHMRLRNNQLSGSIPVELGNLTGLTFLDLQSNQLSGSIPVELGNLTGLTRLALNENQLSGGIPTELGNLAGLTFLHLRTNQLSGGIPTELGLLTNLTFLDLGFNQLSGSIPTVLGNLTNLTSLNLRTNQLSGSIPVELGNLTSLTFLDLQSNQLSGSIPTVLGNLTSLTFLHLGFNQLSGSIPTVLGNLTSLTFLHLGFNQLSGSIPTVLGNLTNLTSLNLRTNQLSGSIPVELGNLTSLIFLDLQSNQLDGIVPFPVAQVGAPIGPGCIFVDNSNLCMPLEPAYQALGDPICGLALGTNNCPNLNTPPTADAGEDQSAECTGSEGASVMVDASGSSDDDGDVFTFSWTDENNTLLAGPTTDPTVSLTLPLGVHTITLTVDDGTEIDTDEVIITVEDTTSPEISVAPDPLMLWPPNHGYHDLSVSDFVTGAGDNCDADVSVGNVIITEVHSDESENGIGDGNTVNDIVLSGDCASVDLRAERKGNGNGRVYTLMVASTDGSGNTGTAVYSVHVPHNKKRPAIDDGPAYMVQCGAATINIATSRDVPSAFVVEGNYPNPFNPATTIRFGVPEASPVSLVVFDVTGRIVGNLVEGRVEAGIHEVRFEAPRLPSGLYLYRLQTPLGSYTGRMLLMK